MIFNFKNLNILIHKSIAIILCFIANLSYAFVGGGHGGGGGSHGGSHGGFGSHGSTSGSQDFQDGLYTLAVFVLLILLFAGFDNLKEKYGWNRVFRKKRQKKYIDKCKHTKSKAKRIYSRKQIESALVKLKVQAIRERQSIEYSTIKNNKKLNSYVLKSFERLQQAWSDQDRTKLLRVCNNEKYSSSLCAQMDKMRQLGVFNYIEDTQVTECHLVKCYQSKTHYQKILRFAIKGKQIDEYTTERYYINPGIFQYRDFNCIVDVVPFPRSVKIYQIKFDEHVDDYVMRETKNIKSR